MLTEASRLARFTNEGGVDGRVRYLHNVMGLWLLTESVREWERDGETLSVPELVAQAAALDGCGTGMPCRSSMWTMRCSCLRATCRGDLLVVARQRPAGAHVPAGDRAQHPAQPGGGVRQVDPRGIELSGATVSVVHLVGGGSQNAMLCQLTADATGLPVVAGPVEATAIGNVLVQARALGWISGDLEALRALVVASFPVVRYEPRR